MSGLVYEDDKQVVKLEVCKLYDTQCGCEGRTVVGVAECHVEDLIDGVQENRIVIES